MYRLQSVATAVVQLFVPEPPHYTQWMKKDCGVLCLVAEKKNKPNNQKQPTLWLRIYCLIRRTTLWEQKFDGHFVYRAPTAYFHTVSAVHVSYILKLLGNAEFLDRCRNFFLEYSDRSQFCR